MIVIIIALFVLPTHGSFDYADGETAETYDVDYTQLADASTHAEHHEHKIGYSPGSSLRSIAEGSSDSAKDALNNQDAAGHQAAYVAKNTLARAAAGASRTAQAAFAGKRIILAGLEQQYRSAQLALDAEKTQLMAAEKSAATSKNAAEEARAHVQVLQNTLNAAMAAASTIGKAAGAAAGELAAQQAMVGAAKQKLESIAHRLQSVRIDFEATRHAAMKAQAAAQEAAVNAAAAAAAAAAELANKPHHKKHDVKRESPAESVNTPVQVVVVDNGATGEKLVQNPNENVQIQEGDFYNPFFHSE